MITNAKIESLISIHFPEGDTVITRLRYATARAAAGGALGVAGLMALTPATAHAAAPTDRAAAASELPPVGEHDTEPLAGDFTFTLNGQQCHAHAAGSVNEYVIAQDAAADADTVMEGGLHLHGTETCDSGSDQTRAASGGSITIEQNDVDIDPKSLLRITQSFPPKFEQIMVLSFTMVIEQPEASNVHVRAGYEPLILTTKDPAKLVGMLTQFPPKGDLYQLQNPVHLVDLENPDTVVATIQKFPVKVGGL